jgi:iron complex transport system substrate-binding protein
MRRLLWLGLAALLCLAVGCGKSDLVKLKHPAKFYRSIVSLSPGTTEIISLNIMSAKLVGRTPNCNYPKTVDKVDVVLKGTKPDYEKIAGIKPDLIVYDPILYNDSDVAKLKELGIDLFPLKAGSIREFEESIFSLGAVTQSETNVSDYVQKIEAAMRHTGDKAGPKVAVILSGGGAEDMIAGDSSFQADLVKGAGGTPVGPKADRFVPLNVESLIRDDPDAIVVPGEAKDAKAVEADPRLQALKAVRLHRVFQEDGDKMLRAGSRVDAAITDLAGFLGT